MVALRLETLLIDSLNSVIDYKPLRTLTMEHSAAVPAVLNEVSSPDNFDTIELATMDTMRSERQMSEADEEESMAARIERLGRERPKAFKSLWAEVGFVFTISMSQVLTVSSLLIHCHFVMILSWYIAKQRLTLHRSISSLVLQ